MKNRSVPFLVLLLWVVPVAGEERVVDPSDPAAFPTIGEAINRAQSGDKVRIAPGIYRELVFLKNGVRIEGAGPEHTTIEYDRGQAVVIGNQVVGASIAGLTLQHETGSSPCGSPVIDCDGCLNLVVENNVILGSGYIGVKLKRSSKVRISNNVLADHLSAGVVSLSTNGLEIHDNLFEDNSSGGVALIGSYADVVDNTFVNNLGWGVLVGPAGDKVGRARIDGNTIRGSRNPILEASLPGADPIELGRNECPLAISEWVTYPRDARRYDPRYMRNPDDVWVFYLNFNPPRTAATDVRPCSGEER